MMRDIKIIVKENDTRLYFDEETGETVEMKISTVGVKLLHNGEYYGEYNVFNKPTLDVSDVVGAANELLCDLLRFSQEGADNEEGADNDQRESYRRTQEPS